MKAGMIIRRFVTVSKSILTNTHLGGTINGRAATKAWLGALALAVLAFLVGPGVPQARGQTTNEVEELKRQLRQLQENFERVQREQRQQIDALTRKLDELAKPQPAEAERKKLEQELAAELEKVPSGAQLHVDLDGLQYIDHACLDLIMNWGKQHEATGGQLVINWETLHGRFRRESNGASAKS